MLSRNDVENKEENVDESAEISSVHKILSSS